MTPERGVVLGLTLVAAALRFSGLGRLGLTHFDEGVYAFAGLWSVAPGGINPDVIAYAPPGFPILVGLAYAVLGVSDIAALLVGLVCGVATIPVAAWLGRRTFGPGAGGAAAAFAALAVVHIAFSRKALTDVPFLLVWLVAIGLGGRLLERPSLLRAFGFGLAVGIAQNFKYNGWLAGVVVVLAAAFGLGFDAQSRKRDAIARTFGCLLLAACVAGLVYLPWFRFVENHGGYAALVRHHQSYLQGPSAWTRNWSQQLAQVSALSGWRFWGATTWIVAWLAAGYSACGRRFVAGRSPTDGTRFRIGGLLGAAFLAAIPDLAWWGGLAWFAWLVIDPRPAVRVVAAWWLLLTILTPLYTPYARLWLPLHGAGWILMAGAVVALGPFSEASATYYRGNVLYSPRVLAQCAAVLLCLVAARVHWVWIGGEPAVFPLRAFYRPTNDFRVAVGEALAFRLQRPPGDPALLVLARRPAAFYLAQAGRTPFRLLAGPEDLKSGVDWSEEWGLVDEALMRAPESFQIVPPLGKLGLGARARWETILDPVTLLDVDPGVVHELEVPLVPAAIVLLEPTQGRPRNVRPDPIPILNPR